MAGRAKPTGDAGARATGASQRPKGVRTRDPRWWWEPPDGPERARDKTRNNKRRGKIKVETPKTLPFHPEGVEASGTARGRASWRARMDSPGCRPSGRALVTGWYYIGTQISHQAQFNRASRTNCQQDSQPIQCAMRESSAATVHAKARQKYAPGGTTPDSRVPILLG